MATYYISAAGLSTNTGTSTGSPWSISKFTSTAFVAGDIILFNKGDVFTGAFNFVKSGAAGNLITLDAYGSGTNPEFNGAAGNNSALYFNGCSYLSINNLVVRNCSTSCQAPFDLNNCNNITIYNCYAGVGKRGMNLTNCTGNIVVDTCWFSKFTDAVSGTAPASGGGSGIQWNTCSGSGNKVIRCKFYTDGSVTTNGVGDIISIYKCNFGTGDTFSAGNFGMEVTANQVRGGSSSPSGYAAVVGGDVGGSNQYIHANTFINPGKVGAQVQGGTNINLSDNIIYGGTFSYTSVGIAFGNYSNLPCNTVTIGGNKINFYSASNSGIYNKWWDSAAKTYPAFQPTNWTTNTGDHTADAGAYNALLPDPLFVDGAWNTASSLVFGTLPTKSYGDANFAPGATSSSSITYTSSDTTVATIVSGNIHIVGAGSCTITANDGTSSINQPFTVNKVGLTVTATSLSRTYGAANPTLTYTITGFVNSETSSVLITQPTPSTTVTTSFNVGSYPIAISGAVANNYSFTYVSGTLTVNKTALTVTANSLSKVYGAANPTLTLTYSGFVNFETTSSLTTVPTATTTATTASSVGTYNIVPSGGVATNYSFTYVNGVLTVNKATLTITANNATMIYCGTVPTITLTYSGFVNGDTSAVLSPGVTISPGTISGNPVGVYTSTLSGAAATNYTITYVSGTVTVNKATITATADAKSRVFNTANPTFTVTCTGFLNGDTVLNLGAIPTASTTATTSSTVGTYTITPSGGSATNYTFSYVNGTLTITAPAFSFPAITPVSYGASDFDPGATSPNGITYTSSNSAVATIVSNKVHVVGVGTSSITATDGATTQPNTLTVNKATLTVTADSHIMAQGSSVPTLSITYTGFIGSETTANLTTIPTASTTATSGSAVGTYSIIPSGGSATNYTFSYVNGAMIIVSGAVIHINVPITLLL